MIQQCQCSQNALTTSPTNEKNQHLNGALTENTMSLGNSAGLTVGNQVFFKWDLVSPTKRARHRDSQGRLITQWGDHFPVLTHDSREIKLYRRSSRGIIFVLSLYTHENVPKDSLSTPPPGLGLCGRSPTHTVVPTTPTQRGAPVSGLCSSRSSETR